MSRDPDVTLDEGRLKAFFTDDEQVTIQTLTGTVTVSVVNLNVIMLEQRAWWRLRRRRQASLRGARK